MPSCLPFFVPLLNTFLLGYGVLTPILDINDKGKQTIMTAVRHSVLPFFASVFSMHTYHRSGYAALISAESGEQHKIDERDRHVYLHLPRLLLPRDGKA